MKRILFAALLSIVLTLNAQTEQSEYAFTPGDYFFASSSYSLQKNQARYSNTLIFFNDFQYGITSRFSAGAGIIPLFFFGGIASPMWVKTKYVFPMSDRFRMHAGLHFFFIAGADMEEVPYIFNGTLGFTIGTPANNLSLNLYFPFRFDELIDYFQIHPFSLAGRTQITPRTFILGELHTSLLKEVPESPRYGFLIAGAETMFNGINLDYGVVYPYFLLFTEEEHKFWMIPFIGIKLPFQMGGEHK